MKAIALAAILGAMALGCKGLPGASIAGSSKPALRNIQVGPGRPVTAFKKIEMVGSFDLEVQNGPQSDIVLAGDGDSVNDIKFSVSGDTLAITTEENYSSNGSVKISVTMPNLEGVVLNGSGNAKISGLKVENATFAVHGSANIDVDGTAKAVNGTIEGSGNIDLSSLTSEKANVSIDGSGSIKVNASNDLNANVSGSGHVLYKGAPKNLAKSIDGTGEIKSLS